MDMPAEIQIHNQLVGLKGGKGTLVAIHPHILPFNIVLPITFLISSFGMAIGIGGASIISRALGADNTLWVGTWGGGVSRYTPDTNQWQTFTTDNGLVSNDVRTIAVDADNSLWVGTRGGVSRYTPNTNQWQSFTRNDGLANNANAMEKLPHS